MKVFTKCFLLSIALCQLPFALFFCSGQNLNLQGYDERPFHFGFTTGINQNDFHFTQSDEFTTLKDNVYKVNNVKGLGVGLGMLCNVRLEEFFDFRILPTVSFYQRQMEYAFRDSISIQKIESVSMEFPTQIKYKSERRGNFRVYVIAGIKWSFDMASKAKVVDDTLKLKIQNQDLLAEWGFGLDFYNTMFKFSPEIKWSYGFYDIMVDQNNPYSRSLKNLYSSTFLISFHFE